MEYLNYIQGLSEKYGRYLRGVSFRFCFSFLIKKENEHLFDFSLDGCKRFLLNKNSYFVLNCRFLRFPFFFGSYIYLYNIFKMSNTSVLLEFTDNLFNLNYFLTLLVDFNLYLSLEFFKVENFFFFNSIENIIFLFILLHFKIILLRVIIKPFLYFMKFWLCKEK